MKHEIVAIRLKENSVANDLKSIVAIKLDNGEMLSVREAVFNLMWVHSEYYYTHGYFGEETEVEAVRTSDGIFYIKTKANRTTQDNLLSLPRF